MTASPAGTTGRPAPPVPARQPSDFRAAFTDSSTVGLALFPLGIALGVLVVHAGLDWWWATAFTALVYAGSLEFLLIGLVAAATPLAHVALTAFLVNFRHVFYALSFPLHRVGGRLGKAYSSFALTDEAYALTTGEAARSWSGRRIVWLQVLCQLYWVAGGTAGALLGGLVPDRLTGLDFALTALFVVLAVDAYRARRDIPTPVLALVCALVARFAVPGQMLPAALGLFTAGLLARHALAPRKKEEEPARA
ncbi:branched-chain amino acid ABC transporter permease [Streptomyces sp. Ru73]|uniref:AzlC family ABC transporter permease n=1 Tax=Streptomyces sp. Ru73 TaxID=2080748 RepID=UPI000CDCEAF7|nr:AzlC family ABC transporter permease [Streptomyces sp. Ru73]POX36215.1 branched-chain amino acid ABC transporter permease [Streptomyces sp. Ru73]